MRRKLPILTFLLLLSFTLLKAQSTYRSLGTGVSVDLGSATNWQTSPDGGTTWVTAATAPTGLTTGSTILIQTADTWANAVGATTIPLGVTLTNNSTLLGTFTAAKLTCSGTLVYSGTAAQTLPASASFVSSTVGNLTVNNALGVSSNGTISVSGVVNLIAGQFNCNNGGGSFNYKGSITGTNGLLNVAGNFFMQGSAGQIIPGSLLLNTTINKLNVSTTTGGLNNFSSTGPIKISSGIGLYAGIFTLGGTLTVTGATITAAAGAGGITAGSNMVTFNATTAQTIPTGFFTGNSVNNLTLSNALGVTSAGALSIGSSLTITGLSATTLLTVTGTAGLSGDLTIGSFSGTPTSGQQYTIISGTAISGTFTGNLTLPAGYIGTLSYTATTVKLTVYPSTNANLASIALSAGTLSPVFDAATTVYTTSVPNATSTIKITPTVSDAAATIKVNGTTVANGVASGSIVLAVGSNTITTVVTAHDGTTTKTYTVTVTRLALSTDATLSAFALSAGTLSPVFASGTNSYTASVPNAINSITVTPTTNDATATVTVNGTSLTSGLASSAIALSVGSNTITTVVNAQDGTTTQTYTVTVTRTALSTDATLSALALSTGTLSPVFASGTNSYTASVANATSSITITPTLNDATATVTVNGTAVSSGSASGAIALSVGSNTITTVITAQDGSATQTYTVTVTRTALSTDATLSSLVLSNGTLTPAFTSATNSYTTNVANGINSITITPTTNDATATVIVNGTSVTSGSASAAIPLTVGSNTITTLVTAQDGTTTQTYTITVTRAASSDASLAGLNISNGTLSPVFASATTGYMASVTNATTSFTIMPTVTDATATITVNGTAVTSGSASASIALNVGSNIITTKVTAQDGTIQTYTLTVTRAASANADLSNFAISAGTLTPVFSSATTSYAAGVSIGVVSVTVTPTVADATATVIVNGTAVTNGSASGAITINTGSNTITTVVTAQNGTTKTYTLVVTKTALSTNASLSGLALSAGTLSPVFATGTITYAASVNNTTIAITVTPTVADATATVTVNGSTVTSGSASGNVSLAVGSNTISTVVTAQDDVTKQTYTVTVTRAASSNANLASLTLSSGTISPVFASATNSYTASVPNSTSSITITPTIADVNATVKVNGRAVVSGTTSTAISLNVGANTITTTVTAADGITTNTYALVVNRANLTTQTITFAPLNNVTYGAADVTPGASSSNSTIAITYASSNTAVATITSGGAIHVIGAGSTTITASQSGNSIYNAATPVQQTLVVVPAVLTVMANNATKVYGAALPALSVSYSGFTNGDIQTAITTSATASTTATAASAVNTYPVTASGASAANYTFSYVAGSLSVTKAPLTITANTATKVYGAALPTFTASYTGLVNGDTFASLTTQPSFTTTTTTASPVASYPVTPSGAVSANYTITYAAGSLSVTTAPLVITANNATTTYASAAPAFTAAYNGFVNGDDAIKLTTLPVLTTTYTTTSATGAYPVTASGAASANYSITYVAGTLTAGKAVLTVTANNATKVYGVANPALSVSYSGFLNGDASTVVTTQPSIATTATTTSAAGAYPITASGAAATNYSFNYVAGVLSITPATRVFAFGSIATHTYGDTDFNPGAIVNTGETITYTISDATIATIASGLVHIVSAGSVTITATIASNANYADVQPLTQICVINRAAQSISFSTLPVMQVGGPVLSVSLTSSAGLPVTLSSSQPSIASVNGQTITALSVGSTIITATQAGNIDYLPATFSQQLKIQDAVELVKVRPGFSPNGDGINDYLIIEGIQDYPDNKLTIVNRNGLKMFQMSGYNNLSNVFNGRNASGDLLQAGTYFYELELHINGQTKRKAGYIVLKFN